jgi:hypothetical protein
MPPPFVTDCATQGGDPTIGVVVHNSAGGKYLRGRQTPVGKRAYQNRVALSFSMKL